jgi:hypothetical protein
MKKNEKNGLNNSSYSTHRVEYLIFHQEERSGDIPFKIRLLAADILGAE